MGVYTGQENRSMSAQDESVIEAAERPNVTVLETLEHPKPEAAAEPEKTEPAEATTT